MKFPTEGYTPWIVFSAAVTVAIAFGGFIFWRTEGIRDTVESVKTDVAVVKTDTAWIKRILGDRVITSQLMSQPQITAK